MTRKKISTGRGPSLENIRTVKMDESQLKDWKLSKELFKDKETVGTALLEALESNDVESYLEILQTYLKVNKSKIAREANLSRSTVKLALSRRGNPNIKTIAKIVHFGSVEADSRKNR